MSTVFHLNDLDNFEGDLDLDELYIKKQEADAKKLETYNKILHRIHKKIKYTSNICKTEPWCWFQVPTILIGVPDYNYKVCIEFVLQKLRENGFLVQLMIPNILLISWKDWVPTHVRSEIHRRLGHKIDGFGNILEKEKTNEEESKTNNNKDDFKSITDYKSIKTNVYDKSFFDKLNKINDNK